MDRFQKILNFLLNIKQTSELFKNGANAMNTHSLMNLAYDYTTKELDFKERLALQREIMEKYTNFYNSLKKPGNELKGVNLVMPYDTDIGVLENVDDGFKHYIDLDYAEMKDLAEQFGYNYDNKKDRLAFLQMIEDRQHHKLHNKSKGGFLKRLAMNLFLGNLDELIEAEHKKDMYEKRYGMNPDRKLIDMNPDRKLIDIGDVRMAVAKDAGLNVLEFLNPLKFDKVAKVAKKFPKIAQASYNVGLPASREAVYSHTGEREYSPLSVAMGAATNYGTPIMLQRASTRFGRRIDNKNMTDADKFLEWRNIQQINTKNKDLLDRADYLSELENNLAYIKGFGKSEEAPKFLKNYADITTGKSSRKIDKANLKILEEFEANLKKPKIPEKFKGIIKESDLKAGLAKDGKAHILAYDDILKDYGLYDLRDELYDFILNYNDYYDISSKIPKAKETLNKSIKMQKYVEPKLVDIEPKIDSDPRTGKKIDAMYDRKKKYTPKQFDSELYFTTKDSDVLTHDVHDNLAKTLDEIKPRWQLTKKSELKARRAIENELENNKAFSMFRAELENKLGEKQAKEATFWLIEYLKDRSPLSVTTEKITDGIVHFLRKHPNIGEGVENYITNKLGKEQFGGQFLNIAGGALGNVFMEDSDDTESLTDKISKSMKSVYKKDIKDKYQIKPKDVEIIDKIIQNPQYTLGVGYPLEDHEKIRDIQLIYPELFSEIQQKARGREGGK